MKKRILATALSLSMLLPASTGFAAVTVDDIDYSSEISQIESLMAQCDAKNISYDYEMVNYQTIKRFNEYLVSDIENGVDDAVTTYNKAAVDALCTETIENLTAYKNGTKEPMEVTLPDMTNTTVSGGAIKNGSNDVFSIGYNFAHTESYDMNSLGATNAQLETGPTLFWDFSIPFGQEILGSADASAVISVDEKNSGNFSMKVTNNSEKDTDIYMRLYQTVPCKPNTTYNYGAAIKCTDNSTNGVNVAVHGQAWSSGVTATADGAWGSYSGSFTTAADQTSIVYQLIVEGKTVAYFDDMYLTESGSTLNLLKNGDIEGYSNTPSFTQENVGESVAQGYISSESVNGGSKALKVVNTSPKSENVYVMYTQNYPVKPSTTYEVGIYAKYTDTATNGYAINLMGNDWWQGLVSINTPGDTWKKYSTTFTTSENQTSTTLRLLVEGDVTAYFDDMYVMEQGTSENLIVNGDFENARETGNLTEILRALKQGEQYNLGLSVLISPHYFPTNIDGVEYAENMPMFLKYNVLNDNAKALVEAYIRALIPLIKDYPALQNICITNEPSFDPAILPDYYNPIFREWLKAKHGTISALNSTYNLSSGFLGFGKTKYDDWSDIEMSDKGTSDYEAMGYDFLQFNNELFSGWHKFMADIVKEYTSIPLSSKQTNFITSEKETSDRTNFMGGVDPEILAEAMDLAGCDAWDYYDDPASYYETMMWYDYLHSTTGKPVYNSEAHIIRDGNDSTADQPYTAQINSHMQNDLWMSASHGLSMSSIWLWSRSYDSNNVNYESLMTRPDVMAGIGHTALDMSRLSAELGAIHNADRKVAIFYSAPSRILNDNHMLYVYNVYKALVNNGIRPGFVTENSLDKLSEYDALILPGVTNATSAAVTAVQNYAGDILYFGSAMTKNEYNQSQSASISGTSSSSTTESAMATDVTNFITNNSLSRVTLKDSSGNAVSGLDWSYYIDEYKLLVNVTNLDYGTTKNVSVYLDGGQAIEMTDLISGNSITSTTSLAGLQPQLLEITLVEPAEIISIADDSSAQEITWDYTDGYYNGVNIYKLSSSGSFELVATVTEGTSWAYTQSGTYAVKSVDDESAITDADKVTVVSNSVFTLTVSNVKKSGENVSATVQTVNTESSAMQGVVKFEVLDSENNIINYHYQTVTIKGGATDSFKISLPVTDSAAKVKVSAIDSKATNNNIAAKIIEEL